MNVNIKYIDFYEKSLDGKPYEYQGVPFVRIKIKTPTGKILYRNSSSQNDEDRNWRSGETVQIASFKESNGFYEYEINQSNLNIMPQELPTNFAMPQPMPQPIQNSPQPTIDTHVEVLTPETELKVILLEILKELRK